MKHSLILILLSSLILAGCSQQNESIQTDTFTKKQECANLYDVTSNKLIEYSAEKNFNLELQEIFFSPKLNECVYIDTLEDPNIHIIKRLMSYGSNPGGDPINNISCIYKKYDDNNILMDGDCSIFEQKIQELKS